MAGLGNVYLIRDEDLTTAFEKAKADGKEFVVVMDCSSEGDGWAMPGGGGFLETIDLYERICLVGTATARDDLMQAYRENGTLQINRVYNISTGAAAKDESLLPADALQQVRDDICAQQHQRAMEARPWWKKMLGLAP